jgi:FdhD protein
MVVERIRDLDVLKVKSGAAEMAKDRIACEEPLEIRIEQEPLAVIMRTPGDDIELTLGFLYAEEIIRHSDDVGTIAHCKSGTDPNLENVVNVTLAPDRKGSIEAKLAQKKAARSTVTSSSCGVCGKLTIESLQASALPFAEAAVIDTQLISRLPGALRDAQQVFEQTGGLHGAALFDRTGTLLVVREDVGRHNAVDKCVGAMLMREALPVAGAILMVSGRTSFEILQKALMARVQTVAAVSAPSSLAVELARASNMGLCGFVRGEKINVYAGEIATTR